MSDDWNGVERRRKQRFRLAPQITIGELLLALSLLFGAGGALIEIRREVLSQKAYVEEMRKTVAAQTEAMHRTSEALARLEERVVELQRRAR